MNTFETEDGKPLNLQDPGLPARLRVDRDLESLRFRKLAYANLVQRFGGAGLNMMAAAVVEHLLLGEAAVLVLAQDGEHYAPAQRLIQMAVGGEVPR